MNNVQPSTPGFVLTSLSFGQSEIKALKHKKHQPSASVHTSSIAKFDYCLPPDEFNYFDMPDGEQLA
ncbi:MAG TPA: hypothetical protein PLY34_19845 [Ferruginibacter sp.]|nr:hypothetical protein [Ferruginibacter sp.]HPH92851.1 hypothetical protein [Ferruginibacter sp.]